MKKILLTAVLLVSAAGLCAQEKGMQGIGPKIGLYTHTGRGAVFAVGGQFRRCLTDAWRLEASLMIPCRSGASVDLGCDAHYLIALTERWSLYPSAGVSANDLGTWSFGLDVGAGCDYRIRRRWSLSAQCEYRFQTARFVRNPLVISLGTTFMF